MRLPVSVILLFFAQAVLADGQPTNKQFKQAFKSQTAIVAESEPSISIEDGTIEVSVLEFSLNQGSGKLQGAGGRRRLSYTVELKPEGQKTWRGRGLKRKTSRRARAVFRRLKQGSYNARYRVSLKQGKSRPAHSGSRSFTVQ